MPRMKVTENSEERHSEYMKQYLKDNIYKIGYSAQRSTRTRERIAAAAALRGVTPAEYMRAIIEKQLTEDGYPAPTPGSDSTPGASPASADE